MRMQTGYDSPNRLPNCSSIDMLSMFRCTPSSLASSISENATQLGVNNILSGVKPAYSPSFTSLMLTQSRFAPRLQRCRSTWTLSVLYMHKRTGSGVQRTHPSIYCTAQISFLHDIHIQVYQIA